MCERSLDALCELSLLTQELSLFHSKFQGMTAGTSFQLFSEGKPNLNFLDKHFSLSPKIFATYSPKCMMTFLVNYHKQGRLEGAEVGRLPRFSNRGMGGVQNCVKTEKRGKSDNVGHNFPEKGSTTKKGHQ